MNYRDWIIRDPKICDGLPIIKGTQVTLKAVLGHLALGDNIDNILQTYPEMSPVGVRAVIAFAASLADLELSETLSPLLDSKKGVKKMKEALVETLDDQNASVVLSDRHTRQGTIEMAKIYRKILKEDPNNTIAKKKLSEIEKYLKKEN